MNRFRICSFVSIMFILLFLVVGCASTKTAVVEQAPAVATAPKTYESFKGTVTAIEKYGHADTTVKVADLLAAGYEMGDMIKVVYDNGYTFTAPLVGGYDVDKGKACVRTEYGDGYIAFCINYGKMNETAGIDVGSSFTLDLAEKGTYRTEYEARHLERTDERSDYASDEAFANYRAIVSGVLYRGSHPVRADWTRAPYVAAFLEKDGVKTIVDMSDNSDDLAKHLSASNKNASAYVAKLNAAEAIVPLAMSISYTKPDFGKGIAAAVRFILSHEAPYYSHCNEGKDRTGFFAIFTEALLGWDEKAIEDDYMLSYVNYYKIQAGTEKYAIVKRVNYDPMIAFLKGDATTLKDGVKKYALSIGLSEEEISQYVALLSK